MINSPGKVLIFGGYNLLMNKILYDNKFLPALSLVGRLYDNKGMGIIAEVSSSDTNRIISKEYDIDESPSMRSKHMVSIAMATAIKYLETKIDLKPITITLHSSPMFGTKDNKTGLGSSSASIASTIKAVFQGNGLNYKKHLDTIFRLSLIAYKKAGKTPVGFDFATAVYQSNVIYEKTSNIKIDLKNIEGRLGVEVLPTDALDELEVLIYDTGMFLKTEMAVKAFKKVYRKKSLKEDIKQYFIKEYQGVQAMLNRDYQKASEYTVQIRKIMKKIWNEMDIDQEYEPEEYTKVLDDINSKEGVILTRFHGAGGESILVLVHKEKRNDINEYILQNYPYLKLLDAHLNKNSDKLLKSIL